MRRLPGFALPLACGAGVFGVYLLTLTPTVGLIDSGELAAGCFRMNILHPTGYPLYTLLGRLATLLPLGPAVVRAALLSALLGAAGTALLVLLARRAGAGAVPAAVVGCLAGLSMPVWGNAVDAEVYCLTFALFALVWLAALASESNPTMPVLAFLAGLSLTNHMSAVLVLAGVALYLFLERRGSLVKLAPRLILLFLLGLSVYAVLPVRARVGPLFPWGDPRTLERFVWHVTGKQYQVWMFSTGLGAVLRNAARGLGIVGRSLLWAGVAPVLWGVVRLWRQRRALCIGLLVTVALTFLYAANYNIPDIEAYYLPAMVALAIPLAVGLEALARRAGRLRWLMLVAIPAAAALNWRAADRHNDYIALDNARQTLQSAGTDGTIITDWWDIYSAIIYLQQVEDLRPDVCVIDKELLRRSWYYTHLERAYPWLAQSSAAEIAAFREQLDLFEHGRLRESGTIQSRFVDMMTSFVVRHPGRPAYTTFDADAGIDAKQLLPEWRRVPVGLLFELRSDTVVPAFDYAQFRVRVPARRLDERARVVLERYRFFVLRRANALAVQGRFAEAESGLAWYRRQPVVALAPLPRG
jgi:hypothetical protein